jgi:hypothetical protein
MRMEVGGDIWENLIIKFSPISTPSPALMSSQKGRRDTRGTKMMGGYDSTREGDKGESKGKTMSFF